MNFIYRIYEVTQGLINKDVPIQGRVDIIFKSRNYGNRISRII